MVLAAGHGKRMLPLTLTLPKPLVEVAGRPLIDFALDTLARAGVRTAVVNVHHHADRLEAHLRGRSKPAIVISDERDRLLDTGGGIKRALPLLGPDPFLTYNADSLWVEGPHSNLDRLIAAWDPACMDVLMLVAPTATSFGYDGPGDFAMDASGRLRRRREREITPFVFAGVSIMRPELFADTPDGPFSSNLVYDRAIEAERLHGLRLDGEWLHVGTPDAIAVAEERLAARSR